VARCARSRRVEGVRHDVVLLFDELEPQTREIVASLVRGERIGTRITPLARKYVDGEDIPDWDRLAAAGDRRSEQRRRYRDRVDAFGPGSRPVGALARDLSSAGVRLCPSPELALETGNRATLALHRGDRNEPLLVEAAVLRRDGDGSIVLRFDRLGPAERRDLEALLAVLPPVAALDGLDAAVFAAEISDIG